MLKILRRKFIAVSMASMGAVLALIITIMNVSNFISMRDTVSQRMDIAQAVLTGDDRMFIRTGIPDQNNDRFPPDAVRPEDNMPNGEKPEGAGQNDNGRQKGDIRPDDFGGGFGKVNMETRFDIRYFSAVFDEVGSLLSVDVSNIASIGEEGAGELVRAAYAQKRQEGRKANYFYRVIEGAYGANAPENGTKTYIFLDVTREYAAFLSYLIISVIVSAAGMLIVFLLILMLSKLVMKPVAESYEKQKRFITDASHEIKTPLAIIGANAEVLEMDIGEDNEWINSIRRQIGRLTGLTEKLVFLSKMDEMDNVLSFTVFDAGKAIAEAADSFDPVCEAKGLSLEKDIPDGIVYYGDEERVTQAASLLLDNAMKYTPSGGNVSIALFPVKEKKLPAKAAGDEKSGTVDQKRYYSQLKMVVKNDAADIEAGDHDILFERFYRADRSRNSKTGGHGIGLSVVRAIAEAHRGSAHAKSPDGKTMEFAIRLN